MEKMSWIKDLVLAEQEMEESGVIDFSAGFHPERVLQEATLEFMRDLKECFLNASSTFNELKGSTLGHLKLYGISKTKADFMLFRNGFKLIFTIKQPGVIHIFFTNAGSAFMPGQNESQKEAHQPSDTLKARWGAFGELKWTYKDHPISIDHLVRYYMTRFIRESAK